MPYLFSEFQEGLTANPERQSELTNGDLALNTGKNNNGIGNKVLLKAKKSASDTPSIIQAVQQGLITKDNNSPTHETVLNRWQILSNQIITKKNNGQKEKTNWEAKKATLISVQSIIDNLITNLQVFTPRPTQAMVAVSQRMIIYQGKMILDIETLTNIKQSLQNLISY